MRNVIVITKDNEEPFVFGNLQKAIKFFEWPKGTIEKLKLPAEYKGYRIYRKSC